MPMGAHDSVENSTRAKRTRGAASKAGVRTRVFTGANCTPSGDGLWRHPIRGDRHVCHGRDGGRRSDSSLPRGHSPTRRWRTCAAASPRRVCRARKPSPDRSQGVQLATIQALIQYWATDYDWRRCETRLNALPQCKTEIDGIDVHFIQVTSRHEGRAAADRDPRLAGLDHRAARDRRPAYRPDRARRTRRGRVPRGAPLRPRIRLLGRADGARLVRRPRRRGVGEADAPPRLHPLRRARRRRGRRRHRRDGPPGTRGADRHPYEPVRAGPGRRLLPEGNRRGTRGGRRAATFSATGRGYLVEQTTRPQTIGYALLDSPVALAAWMLDHDTDSYYKISSAFVDGKPSGNLTRTTSSTTSPPTG